MKYIALLRGINVGGNKKVPMSDLKECFFHQGFTDVVTILNTGNVVFRSEESLEMVEKRVFHILEREFDFDIPSLVYGYDELTGFIENDSVQNIIASTSKDQKVLFTFARDLKLEEVIQLKKAEEFDLIHAEDALICLHFSVEKTGTRAVMKVMDTVLNKRGTTRNLNTVKKIINKVQTI